MSVANPDKTENAVTNPHPAGNISHSGSSVIEMETSNTYQDFECGCSATVPAGSRIFFMKFAAVSMIVGGAFVYGLFKLFEYLGWM